MPLDSDILKAIYHFREAVDYLLVLREIKKIGGINEYTEELEVFCNQVSHIANELIKYVDNNPEVLELEKLG